MIKVISDPFAMYADVMSMFIASEKVGTSWGLLKFVESSLINFIFIDFIFSWYHGQQGEVTL